LRLSTGFSNVLQKKLNSTLFHTFSVFFATEVFLLVEKHPYHLVVSVIWFLFIINWKRDWVVPSMWLWPSTKRTSENTVSSPKIKGWKTLAVCSKIC